MNTAEGILIVNKPKDWTSHDVVAKIRNTLKVKKVGHGGTLDPTATGVLIVLTGRYTKEAESYLGLDKSYQITVEFGSTTTTGDETGETINQLQMENDKLIHLTNHEVVFALNRLIGTIAQQVPWYSAIKIDGKKLYEYARGKSPEELEILDKEIARPIRDITIYSASVINFIPGTATSYPIAEIEINCSSGTYTRVFVEDLGKVLGVPAHQIFLERKSIGKFSLDNAITVDKFADKEFLRSHLMYK